MMAEVRGDWTGEVLDIEYFLAMIDAQVGCLSAR